jgi:hypothetical protein
METGYHIDRVVVAQLTPICLDHVANAASQIHIQSYNSTTYSDQ